VATTTTDRRGVSAVLLAGSLTLLGLFASGCTAQTPIAPAAAPRHAEKTKVDLLDVAPAAGLRWLVVGSPNRVSADPDLRGAFSLVFAPERLDAFAHSTGFRLDRLPRGAIAGYDLGTLYLAELEGPEAPLVRSRFSDRLVEGGIARSKDGVHRIVGTTSNGDVRALVTVEERCLAFVGGDATMARIVEAYAQKRLRSPTVLHGAGLRELPPAADDALAAFLAPGPFSSEWAGAAGGILAAADAVRIDARKGGAGRVLATLTVAGSYTEDDGAVMKLEQAWRELAESSTGRLLGFDQASGVQARFHLQALTLTAELPIGPLARGLRDATSSDVREILQLDDGDAGSPPLSR